MALAFTDHESMDNIEEGRRLAEVYRIAFLPGVETSSTWQGQLAHVLGYFPNGAAPSLQTFLVERVWRQGTRRNALMLIDRLQYQGIAITVAEYDAEAHAGRYRGSPLLRALLKKGIVSDMEDYKVKIGAADIPQAEEWFYPPIPEVVQAVHQAGGFAALAHPGGYPGTGFFQFDAETIAALAMEGLDGLEVFHPAHNRAQVDYYEQAADRLGLVKTGGSDSHGHSTSGEREVGGMFCDWDEVQQYMEKRA